MRTRGPWRTEGRSPAGSGFDRWPEMTAWRYGTIVGWTAGLRWPFGASSGLILAFIALLLVRRAGTYSTPVDGWGVDLFELSMGALSLASTEGTGMTWSGSTWNGSRWTGASWAGVSRRARAGLAPVGRGPAGRATFWG
jgi:hypothetical protein